MAVCVVGVLKETAANETRVALVPEIADQAARRLGARVLLERGAGARGALPRSARTPTRNLSDAATDSGERRRAVVRAAAQPSMSSNRLKQGAVVDRLHAGLRAARISCARCKSRRITSFAMELVPRISRAQSMDALSSQAAVAGYKAALIAANTLREIPADADHRRRHHPPGAVLVIGAGVAGLQAIATAKRLGAVVEAYDVRSATKDQVKSLGAKFVETGVSAEGAGGYARELTAEEKRQAAGSARCAHRRERCGDQHRLGPRAARRRASSRARRWSA